MWGLGVAVLLVVLVVALPNAWIAATGSGRVADHGANDDTATAPVAIVLGARVYSTGPSPWLQYRLDVAADLYRAGRVDAVLVSGDNSTVGYDEPSEMRDYLVDRGVPAEAITLDYAGFDTYDTCARAHRIFGVDEALLVSQDFHVGRAVAVCRAVGVEAHGVGDTRARGNRGLWMSSWVCEHPAAVKAAWDVISGRDPILGRRETTVDDALAWTRAHRR